MLSGVPAPRYPEGAKLTKKIENVRLNGELEQTTQQAAERKCPRQEFPIWPLWAPKENRRKTLVEKVFLQIDFVFYRPLFKSVVVEIPGDYSGVPLKTALLKKRKKI